MEDYLPDLAVVRLTPAEAAAQLGASLDTGRTGDGGPVSPVTPARLPTAFDTDALRLAVAGGLCFASERLHWLDGAVCLAAAAACQLARLHVRRGTPPAPLPGVPTLRAGAWTTVARDELVPGDVVRVSAGFVPPADLRVLRVDRAPFRTDQSSLTGESAPVDKTAAAFTTADMGPLESPNMVWAETTVVEGEATCVVAAAGGDTVMGHIACLAMASDGEEDYRTWWRARLGWVAAVGVAVAATVIGVGDGDGDDWIELVDVGALALAATAAPWAQHAVAVQRRVLGRLAPAAWQSSFGDLGDVLQASSRAVLLPGVDAPLELGNGESVLVLHGGKLSPEAAAAYGDGAQDDVVSAAAVFGLRRRGDVAVAGSFADAIPMRGFDACVALASAPTAVLKSANAVVPSVEDALELLAVCRERLPRLSAVQLFGVAPALLALVAVGVSAGFGHGFGAAPAVAALASVSPAPIGQRAALGAGMLLSLAAPESGLVPLLAAGSGSPLAVAWAYLSPSGTAVASWVSWVVLGVMALRWVDVGVRWYRWARPSALPSYAGVDSPTAAV